MNYKKKKILLLIAVSGMLIILIYGYSSIIKNDKKLEITNEKLQLRGRSMTDQNLTDYSAFDSPEVLSFLFHPRPDFASVPENSEDLNISVDDNVTIGARLFSTDKNAPTILFFHGNGEIVSDYNDIGPLYNKMGINFLPVDYRGYGRSTGSPTVSTMMKDCHKIFDFVKKYLAGKSFTGPFILMGRSLGSASALELAANYEEDIDALIIESGFANTRPLLKLLGRNIDSLKMKGDGFFNCEKIKKYKNPTLIIHAEFDHIIPFSDGQALFEACPAPDKTFLKIPDANHNTIFAYALERYMTAVKTLANKIGK